MAVAFAAFCVWLGVRFYNRRERWAKWTLAGVVVLPVLYVASYGPAMWFLTVYPKIWVAHGVDVVYGPIMRASAAIGDRCQQQFIEYGAWWSELAYRDDG